MTEAQARRYVEKNGYIFGVSSKYNFGWEHYATAFRSLEAAEEWLYTEEYDFRERELMSKTRAAALVGKKAVEIVLKELKELKE